MEPSTGDVDCKLSKTKDIHDQPTDSVDGVPGSSTELKEAVQGEQSQICSYIWREPGSLVGEGDIIGKDTYLFLAKFIE